MQQSSSKNVKGQSPRKGTCRYDTPDLDIKKLAHKLALCNPTPYSGTWRRNVGSTDNPALTAELYETADMFRHDYLLYNIMRKRASGSSSIETSVRAIDKMKETDASLSELQQTLTWDSLALNEPAVHKILYRAARKIEKLLGSAPAIKSVMAYAGFSHGATTLHKRVEGEACFKYSYEYPEVTPQLARLARLIIKLTPSWERTFKGFTLVEHNRVTTVPKDSTIDRPIACEPTLNMYFQKGLGGYLRALLMRVGINLDDQSINQRLAREGSITGELATVDLASASDSISLAICKLLLPQGWYETCLLFRCERGLLYDGTYIEYNKMSSMGNGFTFELESLLFWGITQACEDAVSDLEQSETHRCSIYGDDIICRGRTVGLLKEVLTVCGFKLNDEKSFWSGPFRESCGKHYFSGVDVTPFFIREEKLTVSGLLLLCNNLRRWNRLCLGEDDPRYTGLYEWLVTLLPSKWQKPRIPDGYGDGALYGTFDECCPTVRKGRFEVKVLQRVRCMVDDEDSRYEALVTFYKGAGAYTCTLARQDIERSDTVLHQQGIKPLTFDSVPVPGSYRIATRTLRLYEWLD